MYRVANRLGSGFAFDQEESVASMKDEITRVVEQPKLRAQQIVEIFAFLFHRVVRAADFGYGEWPHLYGLSLLLSPKDAAVLVVLALDGVGAGVGVATAESRDGSISAEAHVYFGSGPQVGHAPGRKLIPGHIPRWYHPVQGQRSLIPGRRLWWSDRAWRSLWWHHHRSSPHLRPRCRRRPQAQPITQRLPVAPV